MCCGPRRAEEKNMCGAVATPKGGYMDGTGGATPPRVTRAHIHELAPTGVGPCWLLSVPGVAHTDGSVGSTRGPFSGLGFRGVRGW